MSKYKYSKTEQQVNDVLKYHDEELKKGLPERRLSVRECARIQTFPDDYEFIFNDGTNKVSSSEAYKIIGNAVPPLLGYAIGYRLQSIWNDLFGE